VGHVRNDHLVATVRATLVSPKLVAEKLGLKIQEARSSYVLVFCPVHKEKTGSCSLHIARSGSLAVKCWGCEWTGDVLHLVAAANGLEIGRNFKEVLACAAELAGMQPEADALRGGKPAPLRAAPVFVAEPEPGRDYPPAEDVDRLWAACIPVTEDTQVYGLLESRKIDPAVVAAHDNARALHRDTHWSSIPEWAKFRGRHTHARTWTTTGHRLILPVYDSDGVMRSVRGWLVTGEPGMPKRVPPAGYRASELVAANTRAVEMLRGNSSPSRVVVVEGEPDTLARSVLSPRDAVIGIMSGSWHDGFARRVPYGSEIIVRTHLDKAGDRYADEVIRSVEKRARVRRLQPQEAA
jgi:hypothetical protein